MILADTSVLIGFLKGLKGIPYGKLEYVMDNDIPYGICNYVYQELLQGAKNEKEYKLLKEYLNSLPFYELRYGKQSFENAAKMYMNCRKKGVTVRSTLDLLIAEIAIENNLYLIHDDNDFEGISKVHGNLKIY
jgi:predicted nucleic acid-binding protein